MKQNSNNTPLDSKSILKDILKGNNPWGNMKKIPNLTIEESLEFEQLKDRIVIVPMHSLSDNELERLIYFLQKSESGNEQENEPLFTDEQLAQIIQLNDTRKEYTHLYTATLHTITRP